MSDPAVPVLEESSPAALAAAYLTVKAAHNRQRLSDVTEEVKAAAREWVRVCAQANGQPRTSWDGSPWRTEVLEAANRAASMVEFAKSHGGLSPVQVFKQMTGREPGPAAFEDAR